MASAPSVVSGVARAPGNVIFFDQAVWVDEGTRWTPGFLKRIHLTGIQEAAAWRLLPFEVHFLHNTRGRRMHGLGIGAFTPDICGSSGAAAKSKMLELAAIGPSAFAAAQESSTVCCRSIFPQKSPIVLVIVLIVSTIKIPPCSSRRRRRPPLLLGKAVRSSRFESSATRIGKK